MDIKTKELLERTFRFGVEILKFLKSLPNDYIFNIPKGQLAKSATSIGSNYEESQASESKKDFIHKIGIVCKEARESHYWLRVLKAIFPEKRWEEQFNNFITEAEEFRKIFTSIKLSAENGKKR